MKFASGLIDLHNHLLYGMDDGARTISDAEKMLDDAKNNGISTIAATSHVLPGTDQAQYDRHLQVVARLGEARGITVLRGAEYNGRHLPEQPPYTTLGGIENGTVLVDFRIPYLPPNFRAQADDIFNAGYSLVVAHPERTFPIAMLKNLEELAETGIVYQITAASLLGKFGNAPCKMGWTLLTNGFARLIASDAHNIQDRASCLAEAYEIIRKKCGENAVATLQDNARKVLEAPRTTLAPIPLRRFWVDFRKWFGR